MWNTSCHPVVLLAWDNVIPSGRRRPIQQLSHVADGLRPPPGVFPADVPDVGSVPTRDNERGPARRRVTAEEGAASRVYRGRGVLPGGIGSRLPVRPRMPALARVDIPRHTVLPRVVT